MNEKRSSANVSPSNANVTGSMENVILSTANVTLSTENGAWSGANGSQSTTKFIGSSLNVVATGRQWGLEQSIFHRELRYCPAKPADVGLKTPTHGAVERMARAAFYNVTFSQRGFGVFEEARDRAENDVVAECAFLHTF